MAGPTSERVGRGPCPFKGCDEPITYRKSSGGKLTYRCDVCDRSGYAEPGGSGFQSLLASIKKSDAAPVSDPAPEPVADPNKRDASRKSTNSVFSLGALS